MRGGGGIAALLGVAVAGFSLPVPGRAAALFIAALALKLATDRMEDGPERTVLRPAGGAVLAWLALAWGLGLLEPFVALALVALIGACSWLWWQYGNLIEEAEPDVPAEPEPPRPPTADERLDQLLEDAPLDGLPFEDIVAAMEGHMSRATVAARLKERAWRIRHGRWRLRPTGVPDESEQP